MSLCILFLVLNGIFFRYFGLLLLFYFLLVYEICVSWWSFTGVLSDSKSPQVSRTLLSILVDLNNVVIWMVSICPPISNNFSPLSKTLGTVPSASITIGITVTFNFYSFFFYISFKYLPLFSLSLVFILWSAGTAKSTIRQVFFLFIIIIIYSLEFFTSVLADGFSLEFGWQQVPSSLQISPQYSGRSQ